MIEEYQLERHKHYLKMKSMSVLGVLIAILMITPMLLVISIILIWDISKIMTIIVTIIYLFLIFFYVTNIMHMYDNLRVLKQPIYEDNILKSSEAVIVHFLFEPTDKKYMALSAFETNDSVLIEFAPYVLYQTNDKYRPIIAKIDKSTPEWRKISASAHAMKSFNSIKLVAKGNIERPLRYMTNQVFYIDKTTI
ncbi:hypothetical protein AB3K25_10045 [Leuconostoc sp. MS02]|uniref:Uncharacterized protein n=1 Tax=Leuconostoc aquikimchii TaxID=3236804 RepID=A0ABV3S000_9LACO